MSTWRITRALCSCLPLLALSVACDAEVGEEYRGEVMLSLEGSVTTYLELDESKTLALGFMSRDGLALVDGVVTGEFPSRFRFEVTEPPPASALMPGTERDAPADTEIAIGALRTVPRDHEETIPYLLEEGSCESDEAGTSCRGTYTACTPDGRCIERTKRCWEEPCALVAADGTPPAMEAGYGESYVFQSYDVSYTFNMRCGEGQPLASCYREYHRCDVEPSPLERAGSNGVVERCEVLSESGDPELLEQAKSPVGFSSNFTVVYSTRPAEGVFDFPLGAGYNLIKYTAPSDEQWVASKRCESDAAIRATDEYNAAHGTALDPNSEEAELDARAAELARDCPEAGTYSLVEDPSAGGLHIEIGLRPSG